MKTRLRIALLLLGLLIAPLKLWAQGAAFSCDGTFYQIRQVGTTSSLFRVDRSATAYSTVPVNVVNGTTNNLGVLLNGLAYNSQNGYMYALSTNGTGTTLPTQVRMYQIGQGGIVDLGVVTGLNNIQVASGTIDKNGNYYVSSQNTATTPDYNLYRFNLNAPTATGRLAATALRLRNAANSGDLNVTFYDIALNPKDNLLYGVFQNGTLWRIDPNTNAATNQATVTVLDGTPTDTEPVGTSFFDVAGNMFVYTNGTVGTPGSGDFYQVDLVSGVYTRISGIAPATVSDGASCINPDQRIDVVKELVSVVPTATARQYNIRFAVRVKNTATATATNIQVTDILRSTAGTNTTFPTASSVTLVGTGSITNYAAIGSTVAPTLAFNTAYNGQTTNADLLTGDQALTAGQSALIDFTVQVTFPNNPGVPATVQNNTAYASSASGTGVNQGHVQLSNGVIVPPGNLLAEDLSTNSAALPVTANGDAASPTPIRFAPSIEGNVFEDANYGGGVGRSQATSNGGGVNQARVELYSLNTTTQATAFLASVLTDAAGNYVFATGLTAGASYRVRVVNNSVVSNRPGSVNTLLPVQTFISNGTADDINRVGGENPNLVDFGSITTGSLPASNATNAIQSVTTVTLPASGPRLGVDFGFNFSTVVNTRDEGQGSLRQFIINSNTLTNDNLDQADDFQAAAAGVEFANFVIPDGATTTNGLRAGVTAASGYNAATGFTITLASALPVITDANTRINGNRIATGDKVLAVPGTTTGPEVTIDFANFGGLETTAANTRFVNLGLTGARGTGTAATGGDVSQGAAITLSGAATTGSVVNNITAYNNATAAVRLENGATGVTIQNSVLRNGASTADVPGSVTATDGFGIVLEGAINNTITGNIISNNAGNGITLGTGTTTGTPVTNTGNRFENNTISGNGAGTATGTNAGVRIRFGQDNLFLTNTITGNSGDGIIANTGTSNNLFTQNSFFSNGELGIDLTGGSGLNGNNTDLNDNTDVDTGANGILNFPVITQSKINGGSLLVTGFAPAGALVEFFIAAADPSGFGEGQAYIASRTESSTDDTDNRIGNYSGSINGRDQGSETNARRFAFTIPLTPTQQTTLTQSGAAITATATVASAGTSEFSGTSPTTVGPLPVELKAFEVAASNASALLTWSTASEQNNAYFVVERSFDDGRFERIGQVQGRGTTSQTTNYSFTDANVGMQRTGVVYYRLQQVDTDGTASYSPVRTVRFAAGLQAGLAAVGVYPNPVTSQDRTATLILTTLPAGTYEVNVLDATGRVVCTQTVQGGQEQALPMQQLPAGMYLVQVRGNALNLTQRFSKQ